MSRTVPIDTVPPTATPRLNARQRRDRRRGTTVFVIDMGRARLL